MKIVEVPEKTVEDLHGLYIDLRQAEFAVINVASIVKIELYPGSVTPGATDSGYAVKLPMDEDELGAVNNRVESGIRFPAVSQY